MVAKQSQNASAGGTKRSPAQRDRKHLKERLDEGLRELFPASDPLAVTDTRNNQGDTRHLTERIAAHENDEPVIATL